MDTYTSSKNLYTTLTHDTTAGNSSAGMTLVNTYIKIISRLKEFDFLTKKSSTTSVADQSEYQLPRDCALLKSLYFLIDDTKYEPKEITSRSQWDRVTASESDSTYPSYFYIEKNKIYFSPTPSTAGYAIHFIYTKKLKDISAEDYDTGTVTLTNESAAVVGDGTTFTENMIGRYLKYNDEWYEIKSYTDATHITLEYEFDGTTGSGLSYLIGDVSVLPDGYQHIPVYKAVSLYYFSKALRGRGIEFREEYKESIEDMKRYYFEKTIDPVIHEHRQRSMNPNLNPTAEEV